MQLSTMMLVGIALVVLVVTCTLLYVMLRHLFTNKDQLLDPFVIQGDYLIINTLASRPAYRLTDIEIVRFYLMHYRGSYLGKFQVMKTYGEKSRKFSFDGSVYTRRIQFSSSKEDISHSIESMQAVLEAHGIPCDVQILA